MISLFFQIQCIFRDFWGPRLQETMMEKKDQLLCFPGDRHSVGGMDELPWEQHRGKNFPG